MVERASLRLDVSYLADRMMGHGPVHAAIVCDRCRKRQRLYGWIALAVVILGMGDTALLLFIM